MHPITFRKAGASKSLSQHDFFDHGFGGPTIFDVFGSKPVEEFGVSRLSSRDAEVCRGRDNPGSEEVVPDAVHHDAGSEGVFGVGEPICEFFSAYGIFRTGVESKVSFHDGKSSRWHFITWVFRATAVEDFSWARLSKVTNKRVMRAFFAKRCNMGLETFGSSTSFRIVLK